MASFRLTQKQQQRLKPTTTTSDAHFSRRDRSNKDILSLSSACKDTSTNNNSTSSNKPPGTKKLKLSITGGINVIGNVPRNKTTVTFDGASASTYQSGNRGSYFPKLEPYKASNNKNIVIGKVKGNKNEGGKEIQFDADDRLTAKFNVAKSRKISIRNRSIAEAKSKEAEEDQNRWKRKCNIMETSFSHIQKEFEKMVDRLHTLHKVDKDLIRNICCYVQMLTKYRAEFVDENVFKACMFFRLKMTVNAQMLSDLFSVLRREQWEDRLNRRTGDLKTDGKLPLEAFCSFICLLITDNSKKKANIIFSVFDYKNLGYITLKDLDFILAPLFKSFDLNQFDEKLSGGNNEEMDDYESEGKRAEEAVNGLSKMVMQMIDIDGDGELTRLEFETKAIENKHFLYSFGLTLPDSQDLRPFINMLKNKSVFDIKERFRDERNTLLRTSKESNSNFIQSFYPVELDYL